MRPGPGLETCLSSTWIVSLRLALSFTRSLQTVSTMIVQYYALYLSSLIELWDLAAMLHGNTRGPDKISVL